MSPIDRVPLLDLTRIDAAHAADIEAAALRVLRSGRFILGPEVDECERAMAAYTEARHALGVTSGSDALILALMALDIGPGDEVICPSFTFFATGGAIWRVGARPVFADIDPATFNLDVADVERRIGPRTKAILPVHLFGQCADMDPLLELARASGIPVVEDAAQAIGARYRGRSAGTMGVIGCFSFFPTKNLGACGDAGLVTTDDDALAKRLLALRVHGGERRYYHDEVGGNFRIDALQAAILAVKLPLLDAATEARQRNAAMYHELFRGSGVAATADESDRAPLAIPVAREERHIWNQYTLRVRNGRRDDLRAHLADRGVASEVYYPVPLHLQRCFSSLGGRVGDLPETELAVAEVLSLPIFPELTDDEIRFVAEHVLAFFG